MNLLIDVLIMLMRGKVGLKIEADTGRRVYPEVEENKFTTKSRLDLNDLLKRIKNEKQDSKKFNLLVLSGASTLVVVVFLVLSL